MTGSSIYLAKQFRYRALLNTWREKRNITENIKVFLEETGSRSQSHDRRPFYAPRGYLRARTNLRSAARNDN